MKKRMPYEHPEFIFIEVDTTEVIAQSTQTYQTTFTFTIDYEWDSSTKGDLSSKYRNSLWEE